MRVPVIGAHSRFQPDPAGSVQDLSKPADMREGADLQGRRLPESDRCKRLCRPCAQAPDAGPLANFGTTAVPRGMALHLGPSTKKAPFPGPSPIAGQDSNPRPSGYEETPGLSAPASDPRIR